MSSVNIEKPSGSSLSMSNCMERSRTSHAIMKSCVCMRPRDVDAILLARTSPMIAVAAPRITRCRGIGTCRAARR
eukprot:SAG22_NODE_7825_length_704_cov_1.867769_2_plen_75_part_00